MPELHDVLIFAAIGFGAQIIDGGIGMGFGIVSNTVLIALGIPPAVSSASVHTSEVFTSGAAGIFHWRFGNVEKKLFLTLLIPGIIGGALGAYVLSNIESVFIKPFVALYLLVLGYTILHRSLGEFHEEEVQRRFFPLFLLSRGVSAVLHLFRPVGTKLSSRFISSLGFLGSLLDSVGGGGWGPVVNSTLIAKGHDPRYSIGSTGATEFFVTLTISLTFLTLIGLENWPVIVGLLGGGIIASPFSAFICKKLPPKVLLLMVSLMIIALSLFTFQLAITQILS
ncbi:sulfite exporter TauE/SafE family protein [Candidatus Gracilibacteria bacterium]|nr:sulfite exporter TauE/SafE family protein [Candidatus Gracilibacteria bacterium]